MIRKADTMGTFQIESRAQMSMFRSTRCGRGFGLNRGRLALGLVAVLLPDGLSAE